MKKTGIVVAAALAVVVIVGSFYYVNKKMMASSVEETQLTEVQKINTKDLERNYPATPREVVKLYNRILSAYYAGEYTEEEFDSLSERARELFDVQLQETNPVEEYRTAVRKEVGEFETEKKSILQWNVCDSSDVLYLKDGDDSISYVTSSYFVKEGSSYTRTHEMYVLRRDSDQNWKILVYYQIDAPSAAEES